jgi:hypothetical protein
MSRYPVTIEQEAVQIDTAAKKLYGGNKGKVKTRTALAVPEWKTRIL